MTVTPSASALPVERVERAAPAAEEEGVGLAQVERAAERRLEAHALLVHPRQQLGRARDRHVGQQLVGLAAGDAVEIVEEFGLVVRPGHGRRRAIMDEAQIAGVAGVAAAVEFGRRLNDDGAATFPRRRNGGAQRGIAAAQHHHVKRIGKVHVSRDQRQKPGSPPARGRTGSLLAV